VDVETAEAIERLSERIESLEPSLRAEFRDGLGEVRRHAVLLNETLREDIRFVADRSRRWPSRSIPSSCDPGRTNYFGLLR
jgi:hypothetical protein